jgi:hypothetical protein
MGCPFIQDSLVLRIRSVFRRYLVAMNKAGGEPARGKSENLRRQGMLA